MGRLQKSIAISYHAEGILSNGLMRELDEISLYQSRSRKGAAATGGTLKETVYGQLRL
jgi:hypothetical protein